MENLIAYNLQNQRPALLAWAKHKKDSELVHLFLEGNQDAFAVLLHRYHRMIFSILIRALGHNERIERIEDYVQDIITLIVNKLTSGKYKSYDGDRFGGWVRVVAGNFARDQFNRLHISTKERCVDFTIIQNHRLFSCTHPVEKDLIKKEDKAILWSKVSGLPHTQKQVLIMDYFLGIPDKDISEKQNVSINTVFGRRAYGLDNLRAAYGLNRTRK